MGAIMPVDYVASVSFGKDSLAMLLRVIESGMPLDRVVFYDTGMEFQAIYSIRDKVVPVLAEKGIEYVELRPQNPFTYDMLLRPVESEEKGKHSGYGWCGGVCRWGTKQKTTAIDRVAAGCKKHYIGIAADETKRLAALTAPKSAPLEKWGMTESDCLCFCRERGFSWQEPSQTSESGAVDLYDILDRVSCWCCANKNRRELENIYLYLPQYWQKLKNLQARIDRPMKKWKNKQHGDYGDVFTMERIFEMTALQDKRKEFAT